MTDSSERGILNREIQKHVNRQILACCHEVTSLNIVGERFRRLMRGDEGLEVEGVDVYDMQQPQLNIDLSRLSIPPQWLPLALMNQQVFSRKFFPQAERDLYVVIDTTPSMSYPLRRVYHPDGICTREEIPEILKGKPNVLKRMAGILIAAAVRIGFTVRLVEFDLQRIVESPPMRHRVALADIFKRIDHRFARYQTAPVVAATTPPYAPVILRLMKRKGVFIFLGDFMDGAYAWTNHAERRRHLTALNLFGQWGQRPLVVVRINDHRETQLPTEAEYRPERVTGVHQPPGDRCDLNVESASYTPLPPDAEFGEESKHCRDRLAHQQEWARRLSAKLRSCCRSYLTVDDRTLGRRLSKTMDQIWSSFAGI